MSDPAFDARALEARYERLDDLPEALWPAVVTHPSGDLANRIAGVARLRRELLTGTIPGAESLEWPTEPLAGALIRSLEALGIARFLRGQTELVDALIGDALEALAAGDVALGGAVARLLAELEATERARHETEERGRKRRRRGVSIDDATRERLRREAETRVGTQPADEAIGALLGGRWAERIRVWSEIADVFGDLGDLLGIGRDLSQGVLRHHGWLEAARLAELLKRLPQVRELIRTLGRMQTAEDTGGVPVLEQILAPVRRAAEERREVRTPLAPTETRGVERSGAIERMLPSEAALLGHPTLRLLWYARYAERSLATYRVEGVMTERVATEAETQAPTMVPRPPRARGPILVCLDTSGSMSGAPETVAKALVLEALRVAHAERRRCWLYAFSGPSQVAERELALTPEGMGAFLEFLACGFHGGTDVQEPLTRALARVEREDWQRADILIASDGEFGVPPGIPPRLAEARARLGVRVHGVLIGSAASLAMTALCDPLHCFRDWAALLHGRR